MVKFFSGRDWEVDIFVDSLCTEPRCRAMGRCSCACYKIASLFALVPFDWWVQASLATRSKWFGVPSLGGSYKSWGTRCVINSFQGHIGNLFLLFKQAEGQVRKVLTGPFGSGEDCSQHLSMLIRNWPLRPQLVKCAVKLLPEKEWEMGVFAAPSPVPGKGDSCGECSHVHLLRTAPLFARVWGFSGAGRWGFPDNCMSVCWGWESYPFCCGNFLTCVKSRSHSAGLWTSFRGNCFAYSLIQCIYVRKEVQEPPVSLSWPLPYFLPLFLILN